MPHNKRYSKQEINFTKNNFSKLSVEEIASSLDRTPKAVRSKINSLGLNLNELPRNSAYNWSDKEIEFIKTHYPDMSDAKVANVLGLNTSLVCRKRLELGLRINKHEDYINGGYTYRYINGKRVCLHRHNVERSIGRKLTEGERVHHINGDKTNYSIDNLYLCDDRSQHMLVHSNLANVAFNLYKQGVIKFNQDTGEYYL